MTDEMPARFAGAVRNLGFCFLYLVLAEQSDAEISGGLDGVRRMRFGDGEQRDGIHETRGAVARGANPLLNQSKIVGQTHARIVDQKP